MNIKKYLIFAVIVLVGLLIFLFYYFDTSYSLSRKAKDHFEKMEYAKAAKFAKLAYEKNYYNRQAFTIMIQSKNAQAWTDFIRESKALLSWSKNLSKDGISRTDRLRIKMAFQVILGNYKKLEKSSPFIKSELKDEAKELNNYVGRIYKRLFS